MGSKIYDIVMAGLKVVLWYAAAVVYLGSAILHSTVATGFEILFCVGVIALGVVFGTLNIKKFRRLRRELKEMKAAKARATMQVVDTTQPDQPSSNP